MNPKIQKLRAEQKKNTDKIDSLKARNKELERKIIEIENTDIIGLVRESSMTPEQLAAFLAAGGGVPARKEDADNDGEG